MSRVIKGAIYNDEPKFVAVPTMVVSANEEGAQAEEELMTPEAQEHMLAEIRHKEAKASQLLKDAQIQAEIVRQEAKAEADKLMLDTQDKVASLQEEAKSKAMSRDWQRAGRLVLSRFERSSIRSWWMPMLEQNGFSRRLKQPVRIMLLRQKIPLLKWY